MGTGNITLYWYVLCCGFSAFVFIVAASIIGYSKLAKRRKAKRKSLRNHSTNSDSPPAP